MGDQLSLPTASGDVIEGGPADIAMALVERVVWPAAWSIQEQAGPSAATVFYTALLTLLVCDCHKRLGHDTATMIWLAALREMGPPEPRTGGTH